MNKEMNFFSPFSAKKKDKGDSNAVVIGAVCVGLVFIIGTAGYQVGRKIYCNSQIKEYNEYLNDGETSKKIQYSDKLNVKLDSLQQYEKGVTELSAAINTRDIVSSSFLNEISSKLPTDISITDMTISGREISMNCNSKSETAIAEFEHNLQSGKISKVFVENITGESGNYTFNVKCTIKDVE